MSYRSDFYIPENIIGHTGDIDLNPTVYFLTGPAQGPNEYGHITQAHDFGANVGREDVQRSAQYEIRVGAQGNLEEWDNGVCVHPSRSAFIPIAGLSAASKYKLSLSIQRFSEKKGWHTFNEHQQDQMIDFGVVKTR